MIGATVIGAATVCAVVTALIVRNRRNRKSDVIVKWDKVDVILGDLKEKCDTPIEKLREIADDMNVEMNAGLASESGSKLKMIISFVDNLPTG